MVDSSLTLFASEEGLLEEAGYAQLEDYVYAHDAFRNPVFEFHERARHGEDVAAPLLELLRAWLFRHIAYEGAH